jgi:hypothetical protein
MKSVLQDSILGMLFMAPVGTAYGLLAVLSSREEEGLVLPENSLKRTGARGKLLALPPPNARASG